MTAIFQVRDMVSYLASTGWSRRPVRWRGASLWDHPSGAEALVPGGDGMRDADERCADLLAVLAKVESRESAEIAEEIGYPLVDSQSIRMFPAELPSGYISLRGGVRVFEGVRSLIDAAARSVTAPTRSVYLGRHSRDVRLLLDQIQLGPTRPGSYIVTVRVPVGPPAQPDLFDQEPPNRRAVRRLFDAVSAVHLSVLAVQANDDMGEFEYGVDRGVSANLCEALSMFSGGDRQRPFEIGFRWARDLPSGLPAATVPFAEGAGAILWEAGKRLRQLEATGDVEVIGIIEWLIDEPTDPRRLRIRGGVRPVAGGHTAAIAGRETDDTDDGDGELPPAILSGTASSVWVRLAGAPDYALALDAHRLRRRVRVFGRLVSVQRRVEVHPRQGGFTILDGPGL